MAQVMQRTKVNPALLMSIWVAFVASLVCYALSVEYWPRMFISLAGISTFVWVVLSCFLAEMLYLNWRRNGYPPAVGLTLAGVWFCIAFAGWWADPGAADSIAVSKRKRGLTHRARALVIAWWLILASMLLTRGIQDLHVSFWTAMVACLVILWKYTSITMNCLGRDN